MSQSKKTPFTDQLTDSQRLAAKFPARYGVPGYFYPCGPELSPATVAALQEAKGETK